MHYQRGGDKTNGELPAYVRDALDNWPASGTGNRLVHRHILRLANALRHYVEDPGTAGELIRGTIPRRAKPGEIEESVARAYSLESTPKLDRVPRHLADPLLIEQIVAEHFSGQSMLEELRQRSPFPISESTDEIVRTLFPPDSIICVGRDPEHVITAPLRNFRKLEAKELIVPSPMSALYSVDAEAGKHKRSLANTGPRRFIVTDFDIKPTDKRSGNPTIYSDLIKRWEAAGVSIQDAAAALIMYLVGPLVMVVYSGNVSLQAWWFAEGEDESPDSRMRAFFETAVILGGDRAGWITCQLFRMPGAQRSNTGHRQTVHYFNPSKIR